ncbi:MAG: hypothetical protein O3A46_13820, partial [Candidatus Poribacteria bacterium]|nr:hypothetical protein [Candidatus Poribacteria bacterium]
MKRWIYVKSKIADHTRRIGSFITVILLGVIGTAVAAPDTTFIGGAEGPVDARDVAFSWIGEPDATLNPVVGYRVAVDDDAPVFTTNTSLILRDVALGDHRIRVVAVAADFQEDASPAERAFTITGSFRGEAEPNNEPLFAVPITANTTIQGVSQDGDDADWFRIDPTFDRVEITLIFRRAAATFGTTTFQVYRDDPLLNTLVVDRQVTPQMNQRADVTFGAARVPYFIKVQSNPQEPGNSIYLLTAQTTAFGAGVHRDAEPNDSGGAANALALSAASPATRIIGEGTGADWYRVRVDAPSARLLRVTLARLGAGGETVLNGYIGALAATERQALRLVSTTATDQFATFEFGVGVSDLLLHVDGANATGDRPYAVILSLTESPSGASVEIEPNGVDPRQNSRSPSVLPTNGTTFASSWDGTLDVDWYRIDATSPGALSARVTRTGGIGETAVELFSPNFLSLGTATLNAANGQDGLVSAVVSTGAHYLKVSPSNELPSAYRIETHVESPGIFAASHSATRPLRLGDTLTVTVQSTAGNQASFSIGTLRTNLPLFDDGAHQDGASGDGVYVGAYPLRPTDDVRDVPVTVRLRNATGESTRVLQPNVTLDAVPPPSVTGVSATDAPDDDGFALDVSWNGVSAADFADYRVYVSTAPIAIATGLTPAAITTGTSVRVATPRNGVDLFVAVTAADAVGNESVIGGGSITGAVRSLDNRLPLPITGVVAADMPNDFGNVLTARWNASPMVDFAAYRVYSDGAAIESVEGRTPAAELYHPFQTIVDLDAPNDTPLFVAVTVVDASGNESALGATSRFGPAQASAQVAPDASPLALRAPIGDARGNTATVRWNRYAPDGSVFDRVTVQLDNRPPQITSATTATFVGLESGVHTVRVSSSTRNVEVAQSFRVQPFVISESEPNEVASDASVLAPNVTMQGDASGGADWIRADRSPLPMMFHVARSSGEVTVRVYR